MPWAAWCRSPDQGILIPRSPQNMYTMASRPNTQYCVHIRKVTSGSHDTPSSTASGERFRTRYPTVAAWNAWYQPAASTASACMTTTAWAICAPSTGENIGTARAIGWSPMTCGPTPTTPTATSFPEPPGTTRADSVLPDVYDPQQLNRFAYVRNNPIKLVDPDGHAAIAAVALVAFAVSYATGKAVVIAGITFSAAAIIAIVTADAESDDKDNSDNESTDGETGAGGDGNEGSEGPDERRIYEADEKVGWPREVTFPGLPQIRTCGTPASGSSFYRFAALR